MRPRFWGSKKPHFCLPPEKTSSSTENVRSLVDAQLKSGQRPIRGSCWLKLGIEVSPFRILFSPNEARVGRGKLAVLTSVREVVHILSRQKTSYKLETTCAQ